MIGGTVSALVLLALSVGVASPASAAGPLPLLVGACGGSMSTVTACPANVMMLKEAGILAMPSTGGGVVGTAAAPALTNTAGSAIGGATGLLAGIGAIFGINQLFGSPSGTVQGAGVLQTDGVAGQSLQVKGDVPGSTSALNFGTSVGSKSCLGTDPTKCATIYAVAPQAPSGANLCISSNYKSTGSATGYIKWTGGPTESTGGTYAPTQQGWTGCASFSVPAGSVGVAAIANAFNNDYSASQLTGWTGDSGYAPTTPAVAPAAGPSGSVAGSIKRQLWCSDSAGNLVNFVDAQAASLQKGQTVNLHDMTCPAGKTAVDSSVDFIPTDTSKATVPIQPRSNWTPGTNPVLDAAIARPDCSTGSCLLVLSKTNGDPCGSIGQLCPDWAKDPNYQQNYKCTFGGQVVGIDSCSAYRDPSQGVQPNTKPDNTPYRVTDPVVKPGGQTVTDPAGTADPGTGVKPAPLPVDNPGANEDPNGCRSASWVDTLNPFNMFNTITCAMRATFVPNPAKVQASLNSVGTAWAGTAPGQVISIVGGWHLDASLSGCSGIPFTLQGRTMNFLDACPGQPLAPVAQWCNIIAGFLFVAGGVLAIINMIARVIGYRGISESGESS